MMLWLCPLQPQTAIETQGLAHLLRRASYQKIQVARSPLVLVWTKVNKNSPVELKKAYFRCACMPSDSALPVDAPKAGILLKVPELVYTSPMYVGKMGLGCNGSRFETCPAQANQEA